MKDLITRSYSAIKGRGLIDENTTNRDFALKMNEELLEVFDCLQIEENKSHYIEEVVDLATVCIMCVKHLGDFESEFEKVVLKNEKRANELGRS